MKLLVFPHSHFCEKARWALDFKGIPFEPVAVMPGLHLLTPADNETRDACVALEQSMDARLGENIRCILYQTLIDYPKFIGHCFTYPMPRLKRLAFYLIYPVLRRKIYQTYVISDAFVDGARRNFDLAMNELEQRLSQQEYLVTDQFTRTDLSVASMLSLIVVPREHPLPWGELPDPKAKAFLDQYRDHRVSDWVRKMYRDHRLPTPTD